MELTRETIDNVCVCRISGRLDAEAADTFRTMLHQVSALAGGPVVFSLEGVQFIGSACLGALVSCRAKLGKDRAIALFGLGAPVRQVFASAKLDQVFQIASTEADAMMLVKGGDRPGTMA